MKVAIIGSRHYENVRKIKDALFQLKQRFGDELIVISAILISYAFGADVMLAAKPAVSVCV